MSSRLTIGTIGILLLATTATATALPPDGAGSSTFAETRAVGKVSSYPVVVSIGDSYLSGEAGRWAGNSYRNFGGSEETDRAVVKGFGAEANPSQVYGRTAKNGCHRSDMAPIRWAGRGSSITVNLACSGASFKNVISSANGGVSLKGESPQADQLARVAALYDVEAVVVSLGGNTLGFADLVAECGRRYQRKADPCNGPKQAQVESLTPDAMAGVAQALNDIRATLDAAGDTSYRLIVTSYPSVLPRGEGIRYSERSWQRLFVGHCPFWNADATWARDQLVPELAENLRRVSAEAEAEFLDTQDLFEGREVCSERAEQGSKRIDGEWARFVAGIFQGRGQESMHPNAFGQWAIGTCITEILKSASGDYRCSNGGSGSIPNDVSLAGI